MIAGYLEYSVKLELLLKIRVQSLFFDPNGTYMMVIAACQENIEEVEAL